MTPAAVDENGITKVTLLQHCPVSGSAGMVQPCDWRTWIELHDSSPVSKQTQEIISLLLGKKRSALVWPCNRHVLPWRFMNTTGVSKGGHTLAQYIGFTVVAGAAYDGWGGATH